MAEALDKENAALKNETAASNDNLKVKEVFQDKHAGYLSLKKLKDYTPTEKAKFTKWPTESMWTSATPEIIRNLKLKNLHTFTSLNGIYVECLTLELNEDHFGMMLKPDGNDFFSKVKCTSVESERHIRKV